jgi:hypothetical protein
MTTHPYRSPALPSAPEPAGDGCLFCSLRRRFSGVRPGVVLVATVTSAFLLVGIAGDIVAFRMMRLSEKSLSLASSALAKPPPSKPPPPPKAIPPKPVEKAAALPDGWECVASGIAQAGVDSFVVDRAIVDAILELETSRLDLVRFTPPPHGKSLEVPIYVSSPNDPLARLGFLDGDMLSSVNGRGFSSPDVALDAYMSLRTAKDVQLGITRAGLPRTLRYHIR